MSGQSVSGVGGGVGGGLSLQVICDLGADTTLPHTWTPPPGPP